MSQSALRSAKKDEEFYCELQDDGGFNIAWGVGRSEREAADDAERRWRLAFSRANARRPTRKTVVLRQRRTS